MASLNITQMAGATPNVSNFWKLGWTILFSTYYIFYIICTSCKFIKSINIIFTGCICGRLLVKMNKFSKLKPHIVIIIFVGYRILQKRITYLPFRLWWVSRNLKPTSMCAFFYHCSIKTFSQYFDKCIHTLVQYIQLWIHVGILDFMPSSIKYT